MPRRVERPSERTPAELAPVALGPLAIAPDADIEVPSLPRDLPQWARDAVAISQRAREMLAALKPAVVRVLTFWDHRIRNAFVAGNRLTIDASGSYRIER